MVCIQGYIVDLGNRVVAFVRHPADRARWVQTHPSVLLQKCKHCRAAKGMLCRSRTGSFILSAHLDRRKALKNNRQESVKMVPGLAVSEAVRTM